MLNSLVGEFVRERAFVSVTTSEMTKAICDVSKGERKSTEPMRWLHFCVDYAHLLCVS